MSLDSADSDFSGDSDASGRTPSSLDDCGPPPPSGEPLARFDARLAGSTRVFTRAGCPTLESLAGKTAEVWTGCRWATVSVAEVAADRGSKIATVDLANGASVDCSWDHPWALVAGPNIRPTPVRDVGPNHFTASFTAIDPRDLTGSDELGDAYVWGRAFGARIADKRKPRAGRRLDVGEKVFGLSPGSLGQFLAGWADAQGGSYFGPRKTMHDLKILMCRAGVCRTTAYDIQAGCRSLVVSTEDQPKIPNPTDEVRAHRRLGHKGHSRVARVGVADRSPAHLYTVQSDETHLVVVNGILTLC